MNWPRWLVRRLRIGRRHRPAFAAPPATAGILPPAAQPRSQSRSPRVLLRFRDGSTEVVDPGSDAAAAMHALADELRTSW
jgi:hypothetical protein